MLQHQTVTGAATPKEEVCQKMGPARCTQRSSKTPPSIQAPFPGVLNASEIAAAVKLALTNTRLALIVYVCLYMERCD